MMKSEEGDGFEEDDLIRRMPIDEEETLAGCHTKDATHCEVHTVRYTLCTTQWALQIVGNELSKSLLNEVPASC